MCDDEWRDDIDAVSTRKRPFNPPVPRNLCDIFVIHNLCATRNNLMNTDEIHMKVRNIQNIDECDDVMFIHFNGQ